MNLPVAPREEEPNGEDILNRIVKAFKKYTIQTGTHEYRALAMYVAFTHAAVAFDFAPRLLITSAEKRSGKTRTLEIISELCRRPLKTANTSVPVLFRSIDSEDPITIILDEADTIFGTRIKAEQNEDLRGLLNSGFQRGMPVLRMEGKSPNFEVAKFESFSPVVIAAIGELPDTITDRAVNIRLKRRKPTETVSPYRVRRDAPQLHELREELATWVRGNLDALADMEPDSPLEDRAADLWEPLLAIADLAGGDWPAWARATARYFAKRAEDADEESSIGIELLKDIKQAIADYPEDFIASQQLISWLILMIDARWEEDGLTTRKLAMLLKPYEVFPVSDGKNRGYKRARLEEAIDRWLTTSSEIEGPSPQGGLSDGEGSPTDMTGSA